MLLLVASLGLAGCGRSRSAPATPSPQLEPLALGQPVLDRIRSGARSANLVIVVLDAARADHVGCDGYPRETTPSIDQLAKESAVFRNHFAAFPSTKPSTASLFTSLYPHTGEDLTADGGIFTLAKGLKAAGFTTAFFSSNAVASPATGIGGDFEHVFVSPSSRGQAQEERIGLPEDDLWRAPEGLTQVFGKWLAGERQSRFFAYCHLLPPHNPYDAPEDLKELFANGKGPAVRSGRFEFPEAMPSYGRSRPYSPQHWANLYDANLRWGDWGVGEVVRLLREHDLLDDTLLIVTSDHGEAFGEHGYIFHSHAVYDEFVHIPLLIRFPGQRRLVGEVAALTQTVDLLPTVFDLYQIPYPRACARQFPTPAAGGREDQVARLRVRNLRRALAELPGERLGVVSHPLPRGKTEGAIRPGDGIRPRPTTSSRSTRALPRRWLRLSTASRTQGPSVAGFLSPQATAKSAPRARQTKLSDKMRRELKALGYLND